MESSWKKYSKLFKKCKNSQQYSRVKKGEQRNHQKIVS